MKLKKVMLMAALAAAIGSVNMVTAFADETASGETKYGWESDAKNNWRYYDKDGNLASGWIKSEEGDGRGNEVWYYIDPATHIMVSNTTRNIGGVDYTFGDDGSWVAPRTTAPKGHITGGRYYNTWSNLCIPQIIGTTESDFEAADQYTGGEYAAIGSPSLTHDLIGKGAGADTEKGRIVSQWIKDLTVGNTPRHHNIGCRMCFWEHVLDLFTGPDVPVRHTMRLHIFFPLRL